MNQTLEAMREVILAFTSEPNKEEAIETSLKPLLLSFNKKRDCLPESYKTLLRCTQAYMREPSEYKAYEVYDKLLEVWNDISLYNISLNQYIEEKGILDFIIDGVLLTYYSNYPKYGNNKATTYKVQYNVESKKEVRTALKIYSKKGMNNLYL